MNVDEVRDGEWRLLSHDPMTGSQTWMLDLGETYVIKTVQVVDQMLDANASDQVDNLNRRWGDLAQVARVPMNIWQRELAPALHQDDERYVKRWLNDIDHRKFRTKLGNL